MESGEEGQLKVTDVVKHLYSSRARAVDEIRPEFLKALEVVGLPWPGGAGGTRGCTQSKEGSNFSALPGRMCARILERRAQS